MKITKITTTAIAAIGAFGVLGAPLAFGDATDADVTKTSIGQQAKLVDGATIQGWTVTGLKPSTDVIDYKPNGTLWEATATDEAIQGGATPIVSNFNARARNGETYRVLFGAAFYDDSFRKVDGRWLIERTAYRRSFEAMVPTASVPGFQLTASWWATDGRSSLPVV